MKEIPLWDNLHDREEHELPKASNANMIMDI